jgi:hypothetical protein
MVHPFFDELRDPNTRLPDSRHPSNPSKDLPALFDFSQHGELTPPIPFFLSPGYKYGAQKNGLY